MGILMGNYREAASPVSPSHLSPSPKGKGKWETGGREFPSAMATGNGNGKSEALVPVVSANDPFNLAARRRPRDRTGCRNKRDRPEAVLAFFRENPGAELEYGEAQRRFNLKAKYAPELFANLADQGIEVVKVVRLVDSARARVLPEADA